jgi:hypothetical protein
MEAALKGSREIGFTIVSMTVSLVAVFIPVLFLSGILGRLFREFAITISVAILVSGFVSLSLTPMLCSRILKAFGHQKHGESEPPADRGFQAGSPLGVVDATGSQPTRRSRSPNFNPVATAPVLTSQPFPSMLALPRNSSRDGCGMLSVAGPSVWFCWRCSRSWRSSGSSCPIQLPPHFSRPSRPEPFVVTVAVSAISNPDRASR